MRVGPAGAGASPVMAGLIEDAPSGFDVHLTERFTVGAVRVPVRTPSG